NLSFSVLSRALSCFGLSPLLGGVGGRRAGAPRGAAPRGPTTLHHPPPTTADRDCAAAHRPRPRHSHAADPRTPHRAPSNAEGPSRRLEPLVKNNEAFCRSGHPEDQFKVWPTNRDRPAFNAVMGAPLPIDYKQVGYVGERMVAAHRYFHEQARMWLGAEGPEA